jgi:hypothetical protein
MQVISPENLVGYMEQPKASNITKVFEDAYKSPLSIVILVGLDSCVLLPLWRHDDHTVFVSRHHCLCLWDCWHACAH